MQIREDGLYINKFRNAIASLSNEDVEQIYGHNNEVKPANKDVSNTYSYYISLDSLQVSRIEPCIKWNIHICQIEPERLASRHAL